MKNNKIMERAYYLDKLRVVLTALVILHHTVIAYWAMETPRGEKDF